MIVELNFGLFSPCRLSLFSSFVAFSRSLGDGYEKNSVVRKSTRARTYLLYTRRKLNFFLRFNFFIFVSLLISYNKVVSFKVCLVCLFPQVLLAQCRFQSSQSAMAELPTCKCSDIETHVQMPPVSTVWQFPTAAAWQKITHMS